MTVLWMALAAGVLLLALSLKAPTRFAILFTLVMITVAFFPSSGARTGFVWSATFVVVLVLAALALVRRGKVSLPLQFLPLLVLLLVGTLFVWVGGSIQSESAINVLFMIAAWMAGTYLGRVYGDEPSAERAVIVVIFLFLGFEAIIALGQTLGLGWFPLQGRTADLEGGRSSGTFNHPSSLGKVSTLLLVLALPISQSKDKIARRFAMLTVIAAIVATGASVSRTNTLSVILMVIVWSLVQPSTRSLRSRFALPIAVGIGSLFFLGDVLLRFEETNNDARVHFMDVALQQFAQTPWFGVGPGLYVTYVGRFDALTAQGWPVHNMFVLIAVELGIIGAVFFYLPMLIAFLGALKRLRRLDQGADFARSLFAYLPALLFIGSTGWGLLLPSSAMLLFFIVSFAREQYLRPAHAPPDAEIARQTLDKPAGNLRLSESSRGR